MTSLFKRSAVTAAALLLAASALIVLPLLPAFARKHPGIELDLQLTNRNVDFTAEGFDLAVRARTPPDSGLVARPLEEAALVVVAAPAYLQRHRKLRGAADLSHHECLPFVQPNTGLPVPWLLQVDGRVVEVPVSGRLRCTDDILGPVTLARAGAGVLQTYRFLVEEDLRAGRLVEVLADLAGASRPFSLLYPAGRFMPLRVRVLVDYLVAQLTAPRKATVRCTSSGWKRRTPRGGLASAVRTLTLPRKSRS